MCGMLRLCGSDGAGLSTIVEMIGNFGLGNNETCAKCKEVFNILESLVSKVTPDEVKFFLDTLVCGQLPAELRSTCKMLVDGYATQLYELVKSLLVNR